MQTFFVELPSKGLCYSKNNPLRSGVVEIEHLLAQDEMLVFPTADDEAQIVHDKLLNKKLVDKNIDVNEMAVCDRDFILLEIIKNDYSETIELGEEVIDLTEITFDKKKAKFSKKGEYNLLWDKKTKVKCQLFKHKDEIEIISLFDGLKTLNYKIEEYIHLLEIILKKQIVSINKNKEIDSWIEDLDFVTKINFFLFIKENTPTLNFPYGKTNGVDEMFSLLK